MEGNENKSHVGMNCSLDDLIRKEAPRKVNSKVFKNKSTIRNRKINTNRNFKNRINENGIRTCFNKNSSTFYKNRHVKEIKTRSNDKKRKDFQMKIELDKNTSSDKNPEVSSISERDRIVKMIRLEHRDEDYTMQVLLDVNPIIIVNKITGVIQLNSFNCRSSNMLEIWNLLLKPLGLCLQAVNKEGDCTNWSITDGSCYMESFRDGMIVRGSGSRDTARNARFSILEQHIKQLVI